mgnify:CR=1 FL=1
MTTELPPDVLVAKEEFEQLWGDADMQDGVWAQLLVSTAERAQREAFFRQGDRALYRQALARTAAWALLAMERFDRRAAQEAAQ